MEETERIGLGESFQHLSSYEEILPQKDKYSLDAFVTPAPYLGVRRSVMQMSRDAQQDAAAWRTSKPIV